MPTKTKTFGKLYKENEKNDVIMDPIIKTVIGRLKPRIKQSGRVCIERFGCFVVNDIPKRKFWNAAGKKFSVQKAYRKVSFKPSLTFKKYLNER